MREYELMVIINPEVDDRAVEPTLRKFLEVVTRENGTVDNVDIWGRRRLAYEIQKKTEGIYAVVRFHAEPSTSQELDRVLNLNEAIMRTKIIRPEEQRIHPHHDVNGETVAAETASAETAPVEA